jgi:hypothetical protein
MMLPGAVSLGAYEGGALAAVLAAVQAAKGELVVDAMASASAGSITAVVASRSLLRGADPFKLMAATWVDLPSLEGLATHDPISPLSMDNLQDAAETLLRSDTVPDGGADVYRQDVNIRLSMALTSLGGMAYRLPALRDTDTGRTTLTLLSKTNLDWESVEFAPSGADDQFLGAVGGALASGSTPVGFPAMLLDRTDDKADYESRGFVNPKNDWHMWYSDGGDIDNEPFGRLLDLIEDTSTEEDDQRAIVLLQTEPPDAGRNPKWFDPDPDAIPTWTSTFFRVNHIQKGQNYYDDLRRLEKTNSRLAWINEIGGKLEELHEELVSQIDTAQQDKARQRIKAVLAETGSAIAADQAALRQAALGAPGPVAEASVEAAGAESVLSLLQRASGLHGKRQVTVEIISPDIDGGDTPAALKLSGEFLFHFGGFLDIKFRRSDFDLGARNAMTWLESWLPGRVTNADGVLAEVRARYANRGWDEAPMGSASTSKLSLKEQAQLAQLIIHVLHVVEYGLRHDMRRR